MVGTSKGGVGVVSLARIDEALEHQTGTSVADWTRGRGFSRAAEDSASMWSLLTFSFVNPLLKRGAAAPLHMNDLDALADHDASKLVTSNLQKSWGAECIKNPQSPSLWRALLHSETNYKPFFYAGIYAFLESVCCIAQPVLLGEIVSWLESPLSKRMETSDRGGGFAAGLIVCSFLQAIVHHQLYYFTMRGGFNTRTALTGLVHAKLTQLSNSALLKASSGQIINLVSNDASRFDQACINLHFAWTAPMDLIAVVVLLYYRVGLLSTIAGVLVPILCLPLQLWLGKRFRVQRRRTAGFTDERVQHTSEIFSGISSVKAYGWESAFSKVVAMTRDSERASVFVSQAMKAILMAFYLITPLLSSVALFAVYWAQGKPFALSTVFSALALVQVKL
jgi:ATP-binding cassette subfamily C (CFTR/MRP) protein 4